MEKFIEFLQINALPLISGFFLLVSLITLIISQGVISKKEGFVIKRIKEETGCIRIFRLNLKAQKVEFFNLTDMRAVKYQSVEDFFSSFPGKEGAKVKDWVDSILAGRNSSDFLEVDVYFRNAKKLAPSFLKLSHYDSESRIIHLESYLLKYNVFKRRSGRKSMSSADDFSRALKSNGSVNGMTFCFAVESKDTSRNKKNADPAIVSSKLEDVISPFVVGNQKIIKTGSGEFVVANFDMMETSQAINFALQVIEAGNKELRSKRNKGQNEYVVKAGIVANKDLLGDGDLILEQTRSAAQSAISSHASIHLYHKGDEIAAVKDDISYRTEVERIIYEKKLAFSYRPIYQVSTSRICSYISKTQPIGTAFGTMEELENYAERAKDAKNLFAATAKNIIPRFVNERIDKRHSLYLSVRVSELPYVISTLARMPTTKNVTLFLLFQESDVAAGLDTKALPDFLLDLDNLKKAGYKISFLLADKTLMLDNSVYSKADSFIVSFGNRGGSASIDTRIRSELHALVERLLCYKKPIIGDDLESWNAIELVVTSGIDYISSDAISPYEVIFHPLNDKVVARIDDMKGKN